MIGSSEDLKRLVLFTQQLQEDVVFSTVEEALKNQKKFQVLFIEKGDYTFSDVIELRKSFPTQKICMLGSGSDEVFTKTCLAQDILYLDNEKSERERLDIIQKVWYGLQEQAEYQNVVALHGTHRQVGVTQLALSLGHTLGDWNHSPIVIGLNPYNPGEYPELKAAYSFEQIYDLVKSNVIEDGEGLMQYLTKIDSFYYLVGNRDFYKAGEFEKDIVAKIIDIAKEKFDLVILDVGSFYDSYLPLMGLQMSNTHILVSSQEFISLDEYQRWYDQVLSRFPLHPKTTLQVVSKFASKAVITPKQLEEQHGVPVVAHIPFFPEANDAIFEDGILTLAGYKPYSKVIDGVAKTIVGEVSATNYSHTQKKGLAKWLSRGK